MYHGLFMCSPIIKGHLACSQVLAIMDKAAINVFVQILCEPKFLTDLGKYGGMRLLDYMV